MPKTSVQAAAEGMPKISRRTALGLLGAAAVPSAGAVAISAAAAPQAPMTIDRYLTTASPQQRMLYHATELAAAMNELEPRFDWQWIRKPGFVLIMGDDREVRS
jgi:ABC-type glycerol-3-phosphate transport system substrate-binding protein